MEEYICNIFTPEHRLSDIIFKMSGTNFDDSCLKDLYDEHLSEDYVSIPRAEVLDGRNIQRHNLFCGNSLNGKLVHCKCV